MLTLTPQLHLVLSAFLRERLGLHYRPDDRELIEDRVGARALDDGFESLLDYYYHLRYDDPAGDALARLADALVVNESYFFREFDTLVMLLEHVIRPAVARGERPVVWSAACAAGEEPLSLAMLLDRAGLLEATELHASDLSSKALARARGGVWGSRALRGVPDQGLADRYLTVARDGTVSILPRLVEAVRWRRLNLFEPTEIAAMPVCHAILCRNVLIYFDDDGVARTVAALSDRLRPGGLLCVGVSESLLRFGGKLRCEEHHGVFSYRKPA